MTPADHKIVPTYITPTSSSIASIQSTITDYTVSAYNESMDIDLAQEFQAFADLRINDIILANADGIVVVLNPVQTIVHNDVNTSYMRNVIDLQSAETISNQQMEHVSNRSLRPLAKLSSTVENCNGFTTIVPSGTGCDSVNATTNQNLKR
jgi:hypothetical protein